MGFNWDKRNARINHERVVAELRVRREEFRELLDIETQRAVKFIEDDIQQEIHRLFSGRREDAKE